MAGKREDTLTSLKQRLADEEKARKALAQQDAERAKHERTLRAQIRKLEDAETRATTLARQAAIGQALDEAALAYGTLDALVLYAQVGMLACAAGLGQFDAETLSKVFPRMVEQLRQCGGDPEELAPQVYVIAGGTREEV
jgi:NAD(P)-dependent dehydrogenase (short-subunit alcohol dehydrogenase family)